VSVTGLLASAQGPAREHDLLVLDLDGVVYVGDHAVPGAVASLTAARGTGTRWCFVTNNASRPPDVVAEHLTRLGLDVRPGDVVTSSQAAAQLVLDRFGPGTPVLAVGGPGVAAACRELGLATVGSATEHPVAVVQGYGADVGWTDLAEAAFAIQAGAWWVATNTDATLPTPRGPAPGNGALVASVRAAVGVDPVVAGKPEPALFTTAARRAAASRPLVVGDRLDTDVAGAVRAGQHSMLVLTGVSRPLDVITAPPELRPSYVAADLAGLLRPHAAAVADGDGWRCGEARVGWVDGVLDGEGTADADDTLDLLRAACAAAWERGGDTPVRVSANLSARLGALRGAAAVGG
jgi:HAD superfamily hydrolase (TIGR01450 family)